MKREEEFCPSQLQQAYVMLVCRNGIKQDMLEKLRSFHFVKEVAKTCGGCDILAKIETKDIGELRDAIDFKIRKIPGIESMSILMCMKPFSKFFCLN